MHFLKLKQLYHFLSIDVWEVVDKWETYFRWTELCYPGLQEETNFLRLISGIGFNIKIESNLYNWRIWVLHTSECFSII